MSLRNISKKLGSFVLSSFRFEIHDKKGPPTGFNYKRASKFLYFSELFEKIKDLPGNVVECGVGKGISFFTFATLIKYHSSDKKLFGFDSFTGFPEPSSKDSSSRNPQKGDSWSEIAQPKELISFLNSNGLKQLSKKGVIRIVPGYFDTTLSKTDTGGIALLHLDVDLYDSYKICLENLFPRVVSGGVILFDEYDNPKWPGAQKAIGEFFGEKKKFIRKNTETGKAYLFKE